MRKFGFTAIELVFTVGYTFTLVFTAVNGLGAAQMTFRDNARRDAINNLATAIDAYYVENRSYPEKLTIGESGSIILLSETDTVPLPNPVAALSQDISSTTQATVYCYKRTDEGYVVGADLEDSGAFEHASISGLKCNWETDLVR